MVAETVAYRQRGTGTGVTLLMSVINDQLVLVCLLYDVSEMNAIKLIGWSERRRRLQAVVMRRVAVPRRRSLRSRSPPAA